MSALRLIFEPWGEPPARKIAKAVEILHGGGVAAYPTDSVYALGCAIEARDAIERIARMKQMKKSQRLALICPDLSSASQYAHLNQTAFRLAQRIFPGPYTLVVPATREVPRTLTDAKRRTVGIRITSHPIAAAIVAGLGRPLLTTSAIAPGAEAACRDAEEILDAFGNHLDVVVDAEATEETPSTVLEVDGDEVVVIRAGQGPLDGIV
ncbi:MAG: threonylcarbamoyl-AMP synthase [Kofleriaceae bacterium]|nr:threonylcarbamoyl-AMP synthase [Kofleriaceae bacterium]MBP9168967.1 threonylcarbamoyl-AMP synthase [Kofleriaceae bacterium]MBP9858820.1 threonylcarbamoyl-AMP synthase [Kofleriaceae bacterium]